MNSIVESSIKTQDAGLEPEGIRTEDEPTRLMGVLGRSVAITTGGVLWGLALWRRSWISVPLTLLGGLFVYRGLSGQRRVIPKFDLDHSDEDYKGIRVERSITINQPVSEVYQYWRMLENLPMFMRHLESVQEMEGGTSHWVARAPFGAHVEWDAQIVAERPNELIAWRSLPESPVHNMGVVRFRHAPGRRGTEVIVLLEYDQPGGAAGALLAKILGEEPNHQMRNDLRRFKQIMETGEVIESDAQHLDG